MICNPKCSKFQANNNQNANSNSNQNQNVYDADYKDVNKNEKK